MEAITGYIEKLGFRQWLHDNHGISISGRDGVQYAEGGTAAEAEIQLAAYDELPAWQAQRRAEIKAEGLSRINGIFPALDSLDEVQFQAELWLSIAPAARQATADFQKAIDIYSAAKDAIAVVNGMNLATVQVYDAVTSPAWP